MSQNLIKRSYDQLFGEHYPDILYYQRDRPHNYNLFLKIIAFFVLLAIVPILTMIPIYPILYILLSYNFNGTEAFSSGVGRMNILWIIVLYVYYITSVSTNKRAEDFAGSFGYIGMFMGLTPIMLYLSWYYASPVSIHDTIAGAYNSLMGKSPFMRGGIAFTNMRCAGDTASKIQGSISIEHTGGGMLPDFFGIGFSGAIILILSGILMTFILLLWMFPSHVSKLNSSNRITLQVQQNNAEKRWWRKAL
jgi:hypothetical protein